MAHTLTRFGAGGLAAVSLLVTAPIASADPSADAVDAIDNRYGASPARELCHRAQFFAVCCMANKVWVMLHRAHGVAPETAQHRGPTAPQLGLCLETACMQRCGSLTPSQTYTR